MAVSIIHTSYERVVCVTEYRHISQHPIKEINLLSLGNNEF